MKKLGAAGVVVGFIVWFGGELIGYPNLTGLAMLILGAVLHFVGRTKTKA